MAVGTTLASAVVMGLFLIVVVSLTRQHGWRAYTPAAAGEGARGAVGGMRNDPAWWTVGFLALVAVFGGGALAMVTGSIPVEAATLQMALAAAGGGVLALFFLFGVYHAVRSRGGAAARAVAVSVWVVGLIVVVGILVKLLLA